MLWSHDNFIYLSRRADQKSRRADYKTCLSDVNSKSADQPVHLGAGGGGGGGAHIRAVRVGAAQSPHFLAWAAPKDPTFFYLDCSGRPACSALEAIKS